VVFLDTGRQEWEDFRKSSCLAIRTIDHPTAWDRQVVIGINFAFSMKQGHNEEFLISVHLWCPVVLQGDRASRPFHPEGSL
jgi:hypothetical protein